MASLGSHSANGENKLQPLILGETGIHDSNREDIW
jgi:hypothetical protein